MSKIYVRLVDSGTIVHCTLQQKTITGKLPVAVKKTPRIAASLKNGLLEEVNYSDAKTIIASAVKTREEVNNKNSATELSRLAEELSKEREDHLSTKKAVKDNLETTSKELEKAKDDLQDITELLATSDKDLEAEKKAHAVTAELLKVAKATPKK